MLNYKFGTYEDTPGWKRFVTHHSMTCDSDAQAEINARNFCVYNGLDGIIIRRGGAEWYVQP